MTSAAWSNWHFHSEFGLALMTFSPHFSSRCVFCFFFAFCQGNERIVSMPGKGEVLHVKMANKIACSDVHFFTGLHYFDKLSSHNTMEQNNCFLYWKSNFPQHKRICMCVRVLCKQSFLSIRSLHSYLSITHQAFKVYWICVNIRIASVCLSFSHLPRTSFTTANSSYFIILSLSICLLK